MAGSPKVMFIGLDAADCDLIRYWASINVLPTFSRLFRCAAHGPTENPFGLYVGAVWPSFFTGLTPAEHGRYCYEQIVPGTYEVRRFQARDVRRRPFWESLSDHGKRVAVFDVPKSPLCGALNGVQLCDWGTHDPDPGGQFATYPQQLGPQILSQFGADSVGDCNRIDRSPAGIAEFRRQLVSRCQTKSRICQQLLDQGDWDLFLTVFAESHCVGHQCWTLHDQRHVAHDAAMASLVGDPLKDVYVALDGALGKLLERAGPETHVFVLASHGMGPHNDATFMLDEILERLDDHGPAWARKANQWCAKQWESATRRVLGREKRKGWINRAHRSFFQIPNNDIYGAVRVNLVGREPRGKVRPGAELDEVYEHLRSALMTLVNVDNDEPIVRGVVRCDDYHSRENLDDLPDFLIEWNRETPISRVYSPHVGHLHRTFKGVRTGDHKPSGHFFAMGPGIVAGETTAPVHVMDFAPTVAALLGTSLDEARGRPIACCAGAGGLRQAA